MLTLTERERLAYIGNDRDALSLISQTEEEYADIISPEHEAMIDDRNRLRDALTECIERMDDAVAQLDALDPDLAHPDLAFAPSFHDAISAANDALRQCDAQIDDTLADKLRKAEKARDDALSLAGNDAKWRSLRDNVRAALFPFASRAYLGDYSCSPLKPAPKWAQRLIVALTGLEKP